MQNRGSKPASQQSVEGSTPNCLQDHYCTHCDATGTEGVVFSWSKYTEIHSILTSWRQPLQYL